MANIKSETNHVEATPHEAQGNGDIERNISRLETPVDEKPGLGFIDEVCIFHGAQTNIYAEKGTES